MTYATRLVRLLLFAALALGVATLACSGSQTGPETVLKPIEERRARAVIEEAITSAGMQPKAPRVLKLNDGSELSEEMGIEGGPYGIAYVTSIEEKKLGSSIPERDPRGDQLRLVQASGGAVVLLIYQLNYRYDAGDTHTASIVTAERKLKRDVHDFLTHVVKQGKAR